MATSRSRYKSGQTCSANQSLNRLCTGAEMQVPLLMALILLSVFPTMPACFYMLAAQYHLKPYQLALQVPQMAFLLASTGFGARAVRLVRLYA